MDPRALALAAGRHFLAKTVPFFAGHRQCSPASSRQATFQPTQIPVNEEKVFTFAESMVKIEIRNTHPASY
jgi:hypothetical protein